MSWRVALYCAAGGACMACMARGQQFPLHFLAGAVLATSLAPVALWGPKGILRQFAVILSLLLIVGVLCSTLEAVVFLPAIRSRVVQEFTAATIANLLLAAVLATLAVVMKLPAGKPEDFAEIRRAPVAAAMILLCGILYLIYFFVFGSIALIFVRKYYSHVLQPGPWFLPYEWMRGALMTLAVLPIIRSLRLRRLYAALAVGAMLWIVGGGAALLLPNPYMVAPQRYIHIVEIMAENVLLGVTAVILLRRATNERGQHR